MAILQTQTIPTFTDLQNQAMQNLYGMYTPEEAQSLWSRQQGPELQRLNDIALGRLKQAYGPQGFQGSPYKMAVQRQMQDYTRQTDASLAQALQNYAQLRGNAMSQIMQASPQQTLAYWEKGPQVYDTKDAGTIIGSPFEMSRRLNSTDAFGREEAETFQNTSRDDYLANYYNQLTEERKAEAKRLAEEREEAKRAAEEEKEEARRYAEEHKYDAEIAARDAAARASLGDYSSLNAWNPDVVPSVPPITSQAYDFYNPPRSDTYWGY